MTVFFSIGMILTTWNYIEKTSWRNLAILSFVWVLGVWLQLGLSVLALSLNLVFISCWIRKQDPRILFQWAVGQILPLISILSIYVLALRYQYVIGGSGVQYLAQGYWDSATRSFGVFIIDQTLDLIHFTNPDAIFFPILLMIGFASTLMNKSRRNILLWIIIPIGLTLTLGLLRIYPYLGTRHDIFLTPPLFILGGLGFDYLLKNNLRKILSTIIIVALGISNYHSILNYYQSPGVEDSRPIINQLRINLQPDDRIYVYYAAEFAFRYYFRNPTQVNPIFIGKNHRGKINLYFSEIDHFLETPGRIWVLLTHCYQNECNQIRDYMQTKRIIELVQSNSDVALYFAP